MATVTRGTTYGVTETITNTKLHALVDSATVTDIVNADISSGAAIADTKLATITSGSKVSGYAMFNLASIVSGAGVIPQANLPTAITQSTTYSLLIASLASIGGGSFTGGVIDNTVIGANTAAAGTFTALQANTSLKVGTPNTGDLLVDNGTSFTRLTIGSNSQVLTSNGTTAAWSNANKPLYDFDTNTGTYTGASSVSKSLTMSSGDVFHIVLEGFVASGTWYPKVEIEGDTANAYGYLTEGRNTSGTYTASGVNNNEIVLIDAGATAIETNYTIDMYVAYRSSAIQMNWNIRSATGKSAFLIGYGSSSYTGTISGTVSITFGAYSGTPTMTGTIYVSKLRTS